MLCPDDCKPSLRQGREQGCGIYILSTGTPGGFVEILEKYCKVQNSNKSLPPPFEYPGFRCFLQETLCLLQSAVRAGPCCLRGAQALSTVKGTFLQWPCAAPLLWGHQGSSARGEDLTVSAGGKPSLLGSPWSGGVASLGS